jgi:internalin A
VLGNNIEPTSQNPKPPRRWLRFGLGTLFLVSTAVIIPIALLSGGASRQRRAVEMVHRLGGEVAYHHQRTGTGVFDGFYSGAEPAAPVWLRQLLGDDYFVTAAQIWIDRSSESTKLKRDDLTLLTGLSHLERLQITCAPLQDEDLEQIGKLSRLEELELDGSRISDEGLSHLTRLTRLKKLSLGADLEDTPTGAPRVTDAGMRYLQGFKELQSLFLENSQLTEDAITQLAALQDIESLSVCFAPGTNAKLQWLKQWPKLSGIILGRVHITEEGWDSLASCSTLTFIYFDHADIDDEGLQKLNRQPGLFLGLSASPIFGWGLAALKNVEHLSMGGLSVTDETVKHLSELSNLRFLDLTGTAITDDGVESLQAIKTLKYLDLSQNDIGDAAVSKLVSLPKLDFLSLCHTQVTDAAFADFSRLPLVSLSLEGSRVTEIAADEFRRKTGVLVDTGHGDK